MMKKKKKMGDTINQGINFIQRKPCEKIKVY